MKVAKHQLRRLATLEAKFNARSVRGLLPLKAATRLADAYHALDELDRMSQRGIALNEEEKERRERLETFLPKMVEKVVLPLGHQYSYADFRRDGQRFYQLSRQWRKSQDGGKPLSRGDQVELTFLTAHHVLYEYGPEGITRREQLRAHAEEQVKELISMSVAASN
jgi:hypothetical protein